LWDVGAGAGSVGIEWMLCHTANRAVAIEREATRAGRVARNAAACGVAGLRVVHGAAPAALVGLAPPDAVFIGGGGHDPAVFDAGWAALRPGGRLVVNAVTIECQALLFERRRALGGSLIRLAVERLDEIGSLHGFRPAMAVVQYCGEKP
jgi:precorrin-6Y C5,15-methyltransferase (decarboxylating)